MRSRVYYVYILASRFRTLYVGITSDLERRLSQHSERRQGSFTARYRISILVHVETFSHPTDAIAREKQLKGWIRAKKVALIDANNPQWMDLRYLDRDGGDPSAPEGASG